MPHNHLARVIAAAPIAALDGCLQQVNAMWAQGVINDDQAQALYEMAAARRQRPRPAPPTITPRPFSIFPPKRPQRSPDRQASLDRRRQLAGSAQLPPATRKGFTQGEAAVLTVIALETATTGDCRLSVGEMAARAGVGISTVHRARAQAVLRGLIAVEARPVRGRKNETNVLRIICREWLAWIARSIGFQTRNPTKTHIKKKDGRAPSPAPKRPIWRPGSGGLAFRRNE